MAAKPPGFPAPALCSGHTTAGTFIVGTLLFVLLPAALHAAEQQRQQRDAKEPPGPAASAAQRCSAWLMAHRWPLWGAAAATTAAGRVLSDAHWCSDVLAGALLGAAVTAATAAVCESGPDAGRMLLSLLDAGRGGASAQSQPRERRDED